MLPLLPVLWKCKLCWFYHLSPTYTKPLQRVSSPGEELLSVSVAAMNTGLHLRIYS